MTEATFTVLIVGGTGVFGSRLVDAALATTDWDVVVVGRDAARTNAFTAARGPRVRSVVLDVRHCSAEQLRATRSHVVVDAAGPFQTSTYGLALAAAEAGLHYVDIADARAFVTGFTNAVGPAASASNVVAVTGASSTPALSNAALDTLTTGWSRIDDILVAISPGNRAPRGLSVIRAILSYAGQRTRVYMHGRWCEARGWGLTRRIDIPGLGWRWASLCDTPDLDILPARFRITHSALFLAGLELAPLHIGLAAASFAVRCKLVSTLAPLAPAARLVAQALYPFGSDKGGMLVEAHGLDRHGRAVQARMTLVAESGEGPIVPILPALATLRALASGRLCLPGASVCAGIVPIADIEAECAGRRITITRTVETVRPALMPGALGSAFASMPACVIALHSPAGRSLWAGRADVARGSTRVANVLAWLFRFPAAARDVPVEVVIEPCGDGERWTRVFAGRTFRSRLRPGRSRGEIEECFGPFAFRIAVTGDADGLRMRVLGWRLGPFSLPRRLAALSNARETQDAQGRFHFDVPIDLPLGLGRMVRYTGWLRYAG